LLTIYGFGLNANFREEYHNEKLAKSYVNIILYNLFLRHTMYLFYIGLFRYKQNNTNSNMILKIKILWYKLHFKVI